MEVQEHDRWWRERGMQQLRDLLYQHWDPIGLKDLAVDSADEYEAYAGHIVRRLRAGADEEELALLLESFRRDMGLPPAEPPLDTAGMIVDWYRAARSSGS
jgi:hypothetical protein